MYILFIKRDRSPCSLFMQFNQVVVPGKSGEKWQIQHRLLTGLNLYHPLHRDVVLPVEALCKQSFYQLIPDLWHSQWASCLIPNPGQLRWVNWYLEWKEIPMFRRRSSVHTEMFKAINQIYWIKGIITPFIKMFVITISKRSSEIKYLPASVERSILL